jgi:hypothetical protein
MIRCSARLAALVGAGALAVSVVGPVTGASAAADVTAPTLSLHAADDVLKIPATGFGRVVLTAHAKDAVGVAAVIVGVFYPDGKLAIDFELPRVSGTAQDGKYSTDWGMDREERPGTYKIRAYAVDEAGNSTDPDIVYDRVAAKQRTHVVNFNAGPEPVAKGHAVRLTGKLERVGSKGWTAFGGRTLNVQFRKTGGSYRTIGTVTTRSDGTFDTSKFKATATGAWRVTFSATALRTASHSESDAVALKK